MDRKIIVLPSRYGIKNELRQLTPVKDTGVESKSYILKSDADYIRTGFTFENRFFIDPAGGIMLIEGQTMEVGEEILVIKKIDFVAGQGHIVTFE